MFAKKQRPPGFTFFYKTNVCLRIISAAAIFYLPLPAFLLSFLLDIIDGDIAAQKVLTIREYEVLDKLLDLWWYSWSLAYSFFYFKSFFLILGLLFIFRLIGALLFFWKKDRFWFFIFPDYFISFFVLFFLIHLFPDLTFLIHKPIIYITLLFIIASKLIQEYWLHFAKLSFAEKIFGIKKNWRED